MAQDADKQHSDRAAPPPERPAGEEGFLRRWSRRKHVARDCQAEADRPTSPPVSPQPENRQASGPEGRVLTDQDMLPLESLDENSDYTGFMSPKVSEDLRRMALRRLFHLPQFNVTDGLDDYDEDYTLFEGLGGTITYEMRRLLEREKDRELAAEGEAENRRSPAPGEESTVRTASESADGLAPTAAAADEDAPEDPLDEPV